MREALISGSAGALITAALHYGEVHADLLRMLAEIALCAMYALLAGEHWSCRKTAYSIIISLLSLSASICFGLLCLSVMLKNGA
jgi:hypothetical protein